ncbi:short-chain dehydrogenase/reductase SDR [Caballeronia turbans]|jgi:NAD(P)-dependent dehydrogenase (short-subunit alcohol dehydrogenase family)|uniref:SDR family NAD(P)-dependent oxidoreductase n=1 Tax=Caballeronia sp. INSB1 TaxID=2921751 RepID=UPI00074BEEED|nr:SDR family oxidoreductase [Caballeronia sp. INSB1]SAL42906.1 short-chain dehydrogenase/reductase SDR [Caballeronia turbans]
MSTSPKVVVVTGASQGIGAGIVQAFRTLDYAVVATSRSIEPSNDSNVLTVAGDIGDPATAQRVISEGLTRFGRIDTLVNNAGIYVGKPFTEYTRGDYAAVMNVNMAGFFYITQLAIAEMEKQASGHVVSVTASIADTAYSGVYSVLAALTKGGVNAATKSLAIEYARKGIRVNAVAPGIIKSPMHPPETHDALRALNPLKRISEVNDIADAILYLDAAPFITGEILHVDGGQYAGR